MPEEFIGIDGETGDVAPGASPAAAQSANLSVTPAPYSYPLSYSSISIPSSAYAAYAAPTYPTTAPYSPSPSANAYSFSSPTSTGYSSSQGTSSYTQPPTSASSSVSPQELTSHLSYSESGNIPTRTVQPGQVQPAAPVTSPSTNQALLASVRPEIARLEEVLPQRVLTSGINLGALSMEINRLIGLLTREGATDSPELRHLMRLRQEIETFQIAGQGMGNSGTGVDGENSTTNAELQPAQNPAGDNNLAGQSGEATLVASAVGVGPSPLASAQANSSSNSAPPSMTS